MVELKRIEDILLRILNKLELIYPDTMDSDANYIDTITVPATSTATLALTFEAGWRIVVSLLYADAAADCTYVWYYKGKPVTGNEIEFVKRQIFSHPEGITLIVTNSGASSADVDVVVKAFGRLIK